MKAKDISRKEYHRLCEISDTERDYLKLVEKHRKRTEREKRNGKQHLTDNLKTKKAMQNLRKHLPDSYYHRGKRNINKDEDWRIFLEDEKKEERDKAKQAQSKEKSDDDEPSPKMSISG